MKTQNFGTFPVLSPTAARCSPALSRRFLISFAYALKNYRENRENGTQQNSPKNPFPSAGFDALEIKSSDWKSSTKQGGYWWKLTLNDGRVIEDFYLTKDKVRGYPDKSNENRYWFIVHHKNGTKIEGFSHEPDYQKRFPDKDKKYWYTIRFTDTYSPAIRQWMEEKDRNYLARLEREKKAKQPEVAGYQQPFEEIQRQPALQRQVQPANLQPTLEEGAYRHTTDLYMKTQNFGEYRCTRYFDIRCFPLPRLAALSALKNYRENRENGTQQDLPKNPFPTAGFDTLDIKSSDWKSSNDWPDKQGRYRWKLTLNDGRVVEDFYWTKDEVRGWPDKSNDKRYWFIVGHKNGTKIEGFSQEPDYEKGYPDKDNNYWYIIRFTDTHCHAIRQWMEEKDRNYLARLEREKKAKQPEVVRYHQPSEKAPKNKKKALQRQVQSQALKPQPTLEENTRRSMSNVIDVDSQRFLHMKTQNFGKSALYSFLCSDAFDGVLDPFDSPPLRGLKNYRENRENGTEQDNPKISFPCAGFDTLDIKDSDRQSYDKWPDNQGRYWWKLTLKDRRVVSDFYWTKDEVRGYPDKNNKDRYWFIVYHKNGTKIEGFSQEPDYEKGFPNKDGLYWRYIQYTECGLIKAWMEEKDKNYLARLEREREVKREEEVLRALNSLSPPSDDLLGLSHIDLVEGINQASLHMKTQNFGTTPHFVLDTSLASPWPGNPLPPSRAATVFSRRLALKNYRENRENGTAVDNPKNPFPSAGFDTLDIKSSTYKPSANGENYYPDKQGRYWWKLTLNDGRVIGDFYWTEDKVRGYPDKSNKDRYWFIVHHKNGTKIEGFSQEADYKKGCPDKDSNYWYTIQFTDTHCLAIAQWMKEKDRNYCARLEREKEIKPAKSLSQGASSSSTSYPNDSQDVSKEFKQDQIAGESPTRRAEDLSLEDLRVTSSESRKPKTKLDNPEMQDRPDFSLQSYSRKQGNLQKKLNKQQEQLEKMLLATSQSSSQSERIAALQNSVAYLKNAIQKNAAIQEERERIFAEPKQAKFYRTVQNKLYEVFIGCIASSSGLLPAKENTTRLGIASTAIGLVGKTIPLPGISALTSAISAIGKTVDAERQHNQAKRQGRVFTPQELPSALEEIARYLTQRYEEQLAELPTPEDEQVKRNAFLKQLSGSKKAILKEDWQSAIEKVAEFAVLRMISALEAKEVSEEHAIEDLLNAVTRKFDKMGKTVNSITNEVGITELPVTKNNTTWTLYGFYTKPGLKYRDTKNQQIKYYQTEDAEPECYGYRWADKKELALHPRKQLVKTTEIENQVTTTASAILVEENNGRRLTVVAEQTTVVSSVASTSTNSSSHMEILVHLQKTQEEMQRRMQMLEQENAAKDAKIQHLESKVEKKVDKTSDEDSTRAIGNKQQQLFLEREKSPQHNMSQSELATNRELAEHDKRLRTLEETLEYPNALSRNPTNPSK